MPSVPLLKPHADGIRRAADIVRAGGLIAYPTETVYGLGVDPYNHDALDRLYEAKGRDRSRPVILLVRGKEDLDRLSVQPTDQASALMNAFWPGPLTLVFHAPDLPDGLGSAAGTIALRQSSSTVARSLLADLEGPLTSTSANASGFPPSRTAEEASVAVGGFVDAIVDGGPSPDALPSTLVDLTVEPFTILRVGSISSEQIQAQLNK